MTGARWLAQQAHEIERDRAGRVSHVQLGQREVIHATHSEPEPARYPLVWRLSPASPREMAWVRDHAARRSMVRPL